MFDVLYRDARSRVAELARSLTGQQLASRVPGTPDWTAQQVVAHLVGAAADMASGNLDGAPAEHWTAAHVRARAGRSLDELLAEWAEVGPVVESALARRTLSPIPVYDLVTHEADLREAFGLGTPPAADVDAVVRAAGKSVLKRYRGPGTLVLRAGEHEWTGGDGPPRAVATVEPYELLRGLFSRRSRRQMRAWRWECDGDPNGGPGEVIEQLPLFGARDDDQPVPV